MLKLYREKCLLRKMHVGDLQPHIGSLSSLLCSSFCPNAQVGQFPFQRRHFLFLTALLLSFLQCPDYIRAAVSLCSCP